MILILAILVAVLFLESPWSIVVLVVGCILEVGEIAVLRRWSKRIDRRTAKTTGSEAMIGQPAEVVEECQPVGTVRVNGELWAARCPEGAARGDTVRVKGVDGLTLVVSPRRVRSA
jgi:membrane protein implicated in regulation of membrane protease activity